MTRGFYQPKGDCPLRLILKLKILVLVRVGHVVLLRQRRFGFRHVDDWHQSAEKQEQGEEQTERTNQHRPVDPCRAEVGPSTREVIA